MKVTSLHIGKTQFQVINDAGKKSKTAIVKQSVSGSLRFSKSGVKGNEVAVHPNAVYAFCSDDYTFWAQELNLETPWELGRMGENITISGMDMDTLSIGDKLYVGTAVLQVSGCRVPCDKLLWRLQQEPDFLVRYMQSGKSGWYMEVLEEGVIAIGDKVRLEKAKNTITVKDLCMVFLTPDTTRERLLELLAMEGMGPQMIAIFTTFLNNHHDINLLKKNYWKGWKPFVIYRIIQESEGVISFYLKPSDDSLVAGYRPGQFVSLKLQIPGQEKPVIRVWSISDFDETHKHYRISIKREPHGLASNFMHDKAYEGMEVEVSSPSGRFVLQRGSLISPVILISAGVGITPMVSMLKAHEMRTDKPIPTLHFIHAAKTEKHVSFKDEIDTIIARNKHFHSHYIFSEEKQKSRLDVEQMKAILKNIGSYFLDKWIPLSPDECEYYVCGPGGFQESVFEFLKSMGANMQKVYSENFHPKANEAIGLTENSEIIFSSENRIFEWTLVENNNLLELAENNGLAPKHACRMGSCGTCKCKLISGKVHYNISPTADFDEDEVLLCCAKPVSSKVVIENL
jgi:ferredoxin-NADP reductase/MOSC domain-containing protein YiiM